MIDAVIFDWKGTLYDSEMRKLYDGAEEVVKELSKYPFLQLHLYGKEKEGSNAMIEEVKRLGLFNFFATVVFTQNKIAKELPFVTKHSVFIGDRLSSEIALGNRIGAHTIWVKQGKFANELAQTTDEIPEHRVTNLRAALGLIIYMCTRI